MDSDSWCKLYTDHGFFWNEALDSLLQEYAGKQFEYLHYIYGDPLKATFSPEALIAESRHCYKYDVSVAFFGEELAPVGQCHNGYVDLLLTSSGNLIGFADYRILTWKKKTTENWRHSIQHLLEGLPHEDLGIVSE